MRKSAVYLLAENRLLREALIRLLSKKSEVSVVGANAYSIAVHREIIAARPQIILMDSSGSKDTRPTLISTLRSALRNVRIVMVDMEWDEETFLDAVRAGVVGYVLKNASALEVAAAIRSVAAGKAVCPPSLCLGLFRCVMQQTASPQAAAWGYDLGTDLHIVASPAEGPRPASLNDPERRRENNSITKAFNSPMATAAEGWRQIILEIRNHTISGRIALVDPSHL